MQSLGVVDRFASAPPIPPVEPDMNAPGVAGLFTLGNWAAAGGLALAVIAIVAGVVFAAVGPRMGFNHARAIGVGGIIGGLAVSVVLALATSALTTLWDIFAI